MAIENLLAALQRDAAAEVEAIRAAAEAAAAALAADAARDRSTQLAGELAAVSARQEAAIGREVAAAARRWRAEVMRARAGVLDRVRQAVGRRLRSMTDVDDRIAARLIDGALSASGDRIAAVRCLPVLVDRVTRRVSPDVVVTGDDRVLGVIATLAGERGTVEATLDAVLDRAWPELRIEVAAWLASERGGDP